VQAKEALSADTDTTIPVLLPSVTTDVRLTRGEFEAMVRPALHGSIEALRRAVRSAGCTPEQLHSVLLVGGSSRMPIVGQLVSAEMGRPVAVDTHPKHAVALGAAWRAGAAFGRPPGRGPVGAPPVHRTPPAGVPVTTQLPVPSQQPGTPPAGVPVASQHPGTPPSGVPMASQFPGTGRTEPVRQPRGTETATARGPETGTRQRIPDMGSGPATRTRPPVAEPIAPPPAEKSDRRKRLLAFGAAGAVVALLAGGGVAFAVFGGDDEDPTRAASTGQVTTTTTQSEASLLPPDEQCTDAIMANPYWVCLTSAVVADGKITIQYVSDGSALTVNGGRHLHIYGGDGTNPSDQVMGHQVSQSEQGKWYVEDRRPAVLDVTDQRFVLAIGDAPKVCARVATPDHVLVTAEDGSYRTGNCVPITRGADTAPEPPVNTTKKKRPPRTNTPTTTTETTTTTTDTTTTEPTPDSEPETPTAENADG
jgi:hypothetical protein